MASREEGGAAPGMEPLRPVVAEAVARRLGHYDLVGRLGRGGTADVYLARSGRAHIGIDKLVVLKQLQPSYRDDPYYVDMFRREARIAARLTHPQVVQTFALEEDRSGDFIVMEYLEGAPLSALLRLVQERSLFQAWGVLVGAVCQALAGLHYVHELRDDDGEPMRLVHRDVKPGNIYVTFDGQVKVLDFGVAKVSALARDATVSAFLKGTVQYMAPEAVDEAQAVDRRADLFSAAVILWEIIHGQRMWGDQSHIQIVRALATKNLPLSANDPLPDVPDELEEVCLRSLSLDPSRRPRDAAAMRQDILRILERYEIPHGADALARMMHAQFGDLRERRVAEIGRVLAHGRGGAETVVAPLAEQRGYALPVPRPGLRRWVLGASALLLASGVAAFAWHAQRPAPPPAEAQTIVVRVTAHPAEARLLWDDRPLASNPAVLEHAPDGTVHTLVVEAPGHRARRIAVTLDRSRDIDVALVPLPPPEPAPEVAMGTVRIESSVRGSVSVDGSPRGDTPIELQLAPGPRRVEITAEGHEPWSGEVLVRAGENAPTVVALHPSEAPTPARARPARRDGVAPAVVAAGVIAAPEPEEEAVVAPPVSDEAPPPSVTEEAPPAPAFRPLDGRTLKAFVAP